MAFNINDFYSRLQFGGARPSLFEVILTNPISSGGLADFRFMCKTSEIPSATLQTIPVNYFGRQLNFAGNREFAPWTVTVINDEDFAIRDNLERWSDTLNGFVSNQTTSGYSASASYKGNADVVQYSKDGNIIRKYKISGLIPTEIAPIELSWDNNAAIEEFTATFSIDFWEVDRSTVNPNATLQVSASASVTAGI